MSSWMNFFQDPVLMAPTGATVAIAIFAGLMGTFLFVQRKSFLAECLSHAAYPGILLSFVLCDLQILGGLLFAFLGYRLLARFERKRMQPDSALALTLSFFLSFGVLLSSIFQHITPALYKQSLIYLYGQAVTMRSFHLVLFGGISFLGFLFTLLTVVRFKYALFDRNYLYSLQGRSKLDVFLFQLLFFFISMATVIGTRSMGAILMAGMMIAPPLFARLFTHRLEWILFLSSLCGAFSALIGMALSVYLPSYVSAEGSIPTGPVILLVAALFVLFGVLFSPKKGILFRFGRLCFFQIKCCKENALKKLRAGDSIGRKEWFLLWIEGFVTKEGLTDKGKKRANYIVRLHRLWELYLAKEVGIQGERLHERAEQMEHLLTPEMEEQLTLALKDPAKDPHQRDIPKREV